MNAASPGAKQRVLFACTHNSARSQMAEAMLNRWGTDAFEARSAGSEATDIKPETRTVMAEIGFDLAGQWSKTIADVRDQPFDWFITVCDDAQESCPVLPGVPNVAHWNVDDPIGLEAFRAARDDIGGRVRLFLQAASGDG